MPRMKALEDTNETLRGELAAASGRCSEAELELSQVRFFAFLFMFSLPYFCLCCPFCFSGDA